MSRTTGMFGLQYCRSPRKTLRTSDMLRLVIGVSGCTTTATSTSWRCAASGCKSVRQRQLKARAREANFQWVVMCVSEGKRSLEKCPIHPRLVHTVTTVPVLAFESRVVSDVVPDPERRTRKIQHIHQRRIIFRLMNILVSIVRLPFALLPGQPVRKLNIERLAVPGIESQHIAMVNVGVFRQEFRFFLGPDHVGRGDPFIEIPARLRRKLVAIYRRTKLKPIESGRSGIQVGYPGAVVIGVAAVS